MPTINKKILKFLARRIVKKYRPKIIAVAGSGENTEVISRVLASKFSTRESKSLFDSEANMLLAIIGAGSVKTANVFMKALKLILTKQKYPEFLILETETGRAGEVKSLFKIARPEVGIITETEKLSNSKRSVREKNLLIKCLRRNELAVLNRDDKAVKNIIEGTRAKITTFGFSEKADVRATEVISEGNNGEEITNFKINYQNSFIPIRLTRRQIYPALAAAAVGLNYGLNLVEIAEALSSKHTNI